MGPDGNIYVISDYGGLGAFALSPGGQLIWSNLGSPIFSENGQIGGVEIVFSSGRLYAAFDERAQGPSTMFGLSLGGTQEWATPMGGSDDAFMQQQRQPATGSDGSLYLTAMGGGNGWGLRRVDPASGNVLWNYSPWPSNGMSAPSVGPDGSVYFSRSLSYLESVTPAGQSRWTFFDGSIIDHPAVSPDGSLVVAGDRPELRRCPDPCADGTPRPERSPGSSTYPVRTVVSRSSNRSLGSRPTAGLRTSAPPSSRAARSTHMCTPSTRVLWLSAWCLRSSG